MGGYDDDMANGIVMGGAHARKVLCSAPWSDMVLECFDSLSRWASTSRGQGSSRQVSQGGKRRNRTKRHRDGAMYMYIYIPCFVVST